MWSRGNKRERITDCKRTMEDGATAAPRKGYIPVIVGNSAVAERFFVQVKLFKDPRIVVLLDMAVRELGLPQGVLRIPCDVEHFRRLVQAISKAT